MDYASIIETIGKSIDLIGVSTIVFGIIFSLIDFVLAYFQKGNVNTPYEKMRANLGRTIIIGLELLIAGDIVRSIAVPPTFTTVGVLALIVFIRAFLSIQVEEGIHWLLPWSHSRPKEKEA